MMGFAAFLLFATTSAGMILIKPSFVASIFIVVQLVTGAALITDEKPPEPTEQITE